MLKFIDFFFTLKITHSMTLKGAMYKINVCQCCELVASLNYHQYQGAGNDASFKQEGATSITFKLLEMMKMIFLNEPR